MRSVKDIPVLHNIPILVRSALNVPVQNGVVTNEYRLRRALPTLSFLAQKGARVVVASHIGEEGTETLEPVASALGKLISNVSFCSTSIGKEAREAVRSLSPGHILVLENLRRNRGEVTNDAEFAKELAHLADAFVQDSFDTCHRNHASIIGVPKFLPSYAGLLVLEEVKELTKALKPRAPSLAIIGGAKFATKEPVLRALLESYDKVFVGGALANDFIRAKGYSVGRSMTSNTPLAEIQKLLNHPRVVLPVDARLVKKDSTDVRISRVTDMKEDEAMLDHGPQTARLLVAIAERSKTVLWNGPLGEYEHGFTDCTDEVATGIASSGAYTVIGGGDTVAEIERIGLLSKFGFVSTGGGAMLDFLAKGQLPGIAVLA